VVIQMADSRETNMPRLGIVPLHDQESGRTLWVNTSSGFFRKNLAGQVKQNSQHLTELCRKHGANFLSLRTDQDYVPQLIKLFKVRSRAGRR